MRVFHPVSHKRFGLVSTVFCLALCAFYIQLSPASAQDSVYEVSDVEVDVTADNAVAAREQAFEEAQVKAYKQLMERILTAQELEGYEMPDLDTISGLVQDFEVTNEQLSAVRYKGTYTFRFRPNAMQSNLAQAEVPYAAAGKKPVLILPYQLTGNASTLWGENNPFMAAWARSGAEKGALVSTIIPLGDMLDTSQASDSQPLNYDKEMLDRMASRYNAEETIILLGEWKEGIGLAVSVYNTKTTLPGFMANIQVPHREGMSVPQVYDQAVSEVLALLKQDYKVQTEVNPNEVSSVKARASFNTVQQWVNLKRSVEATPGVQSVMVKGLKPKEAVVDIEFIGTLSQLGSALRRGGISMDMPTIMQSSYNANMPGETIYELKMTGGTY